mmetsp:Transcript_16313/g.32504  ORF Transcript_16313/g.32504 Transcript_16313/m.32504 type:complete len:271 (+) Transcript_16313:144-956(+)
MDSSMDYIHRVLISFLIFLILVGLVGHYILSLNDPWSPASFDEDLSTLEFDGCNISIKTWSTQITEKIWREKEIEKRLMARLETPRPKKIDANDEADTSTAATPATNGVHFEAYGKRAKELTQIRTNVPLGQAAAAISKSAPLVSRGKLLNAATKFKSRATADVASVNETPNRKADPSRESGDASSNDGLADGKSREVVERLSSELQIEGEDYLVHAAEETDKEHWRKKKAPGEEKKKSEPSRGARKNISITLEEDFALMKGPNSPGTSI